MFLVVHWQDADSSSANEVTKYFPLCNLMLCSGHYIRAHFKVQGVVPCCRNGRMPLLET